MRLLELSETKEGFFSIKHKKKAQQEEGGEKKEQFKFEFWKKASTSNVCHHYDYRKGRQLVYAEVTAKVPSHDTTPHQTVARSLRVVVRSVTHTHLQNNVRSLTHTKQCPRLTHTHKASCALAYAHLNNVLVARQDGSEELPILPFLHRHIRLEAQRPHMCHGTVTLPRTPAPLVPLSRTFFSSRAHLS